MKGGDRPEVQGCDIHLWTVRLEATEKQLTQCLSLLAADERARASRFHFDEHRRAFVFSHAVLRAFLASLTATRPEQVTFSYGPKGKPALQDTAHPVSFNMSHSSGLAVYAFTIGCELGVDIEQIRPVPEMKDIAARFFCPEELEDLMALSQPERPRGFFNCWTRKEAFIKAVGDGLSLPLDSFRVALRPNAPAKLLRLGASVEAARGWMLHDFTPVQDYTGALAYSGQARPLLCHNPIAAGELLEWLRPGEFL
jgi:4'-phosphopantetheinyl transferase